MLKYSICLGPNLFTWLVVVVVWSVFGGRLIWEGGLWCLICRRGGDKGRLHVLGHGGIIFCEDVDKVGRIRDIVEVSDRLSSYEGSCLRFWVQVLPWTFAVLDRSKSSVFTFSMVVSLWITLGIFPSSILIGPIRVAAVKYNHDAALAAEKYTRQKLGLS